MHFCNDLSRILFRYEDGRCYIIPGAPGQRIPIRFCPWCGTRLLAPLTRPHRELDAATLTRWAVEFAPDHIREWERSEYFECFDLWGWLELEHPDLLGEFEHWFRKEKEL